MKSFLNRFVALLLVPCLVADPSLTAGQAGANALASVFSSTPAVSKSVSSGIPKSLFAEEALSARASQFLHSALTRTPAVRVVQAVALSGAIGIASTAWAQEAAAGTVAAPAPHLLRTGDIFVGIVAGVLVMTAFFARRYHLRAGLFKTMQERIGRGERLRYRKEPKVLINRLSVESRKQKLTEIVSQITITTMLTAVFFSAIFGAIAAAWMNLQGFIRWVFSILMLLMTGNVGVGVWRHLANLLSAEQVFLTDEDLPSPGEPPTGPAKRPDGAATEKPTAAKNLARSRIKTALGALGTALITYTLSPFLGWWSIPAGVAIMLGLQLVWYVWTSWPTLPLILSEIYLGYTALRLKRQRESFQRDGQRWLDALDVANHEPRQLSALAAQGTRLIARTHRHQARLQAARKRLVRLRDRTVAKVRGLSDQQVIDIAEKTGEMVQVVNVLNDGMDMDRATLERALASLGQVKRDGNKNNPTAPGTTPKEKGSTLTFVLAGLAVIVVAVTTFTIHYGAMVYTTPTIHHFLGSMGSLLGPWSGFDGTGPLVFLAGIPLLMPLTIRDETHPPTSIAPTAPLPMSAQEASGFFSKRPQLPPSMQKKVSMECLSLRDLKPGQKSLHIGSYQSRLPVAEALMGLSVLAIDMEKNYGNHNPLGTDQRVREEIYKRKASLAFKEGDVFDLELDGPYDHIVTLDMYPSFRSSRVFLEAPREERDLLERTFNEALSKHIFALIAPGGTILIGGAGGLAEVMRSQLKAAKIQFEEYPLGKSMLRTIEDTSLFKLKVQEKPSGMAPTALPSPPAAPDNNKERQGSLLWVGNLGLGVLLASLWLVMVAHRGAFPGYSIGRLAIDEGTAALVTLVVHEGLHFPRRLKDFHLDRRGLHWTKIDDRRLHSGPLGSLLLAITLSFGFSLFPHVPTLMILSVNLLAVNALASIPGTIWFSKMAEGPSRLRRWIGKTGLFLWKGTDGDVARRIRKAPEPQAAATAAEPDAVLELVSTNMRAEAAYRTAKETYLQQVRDTLERARELPVSSDAAALDALRIDLLILLHDGIKLKEQFQQLWDRLLQIARLETSRLDEHFPGEAMKMAGAAEPEALFRELDDPKLRISELVNVYLKLERRIKAVSSRIDQAAAPDKPTKSHMFIPPFLLGGWGSHGWLAPHSLSIPLLLALTMAVLVVQWFTGYGAARGEPRHRRAARWHDHARPLLRAA